MDIPDIIIPSQDLAAQEEMRFDVFNHYLEKGIKTPEDLHRFITSWTEEGMPFINVCPDHQTPFTYLANAFFADYNDEHGRPLGQTHNLVVAPRGGGKTATVGKANAIDLVMKPGIELASLGAIKAQAAKCYKYTRGHLYDKLSARLVLNSILKETVMHNGASYEQLVATMSGVNSPHPQKLRADEVELIDDDAVMEEMFLVPKSKRFKDGRFYRASLDIISTRKFQYGNMQRLIEEADEHNFRLIIWCYKEISEPCPESRHGKKRVVMKLQDPETMEFTRFKLWEGCQHCPLAFSCRGDLVRSKGYYMIDDFIDELKRVSRRTWKAQKECKRPGTEGMVYPDFYDSLGDPASTVIANCSPPSDYLIVEAYDFGGGIGSADPTAVLWLAIKWNATEQLIKDVIVFDEWYAGATINTHTKEILKRRERWGIGKPWKIFGDPSGLQYRIEFAARGIKIQKAFNSIEIGIDKVQNLMERDESGKQSFHVCERCVHTRKETKQYHYPEGGGTLPVDKKNHTCDCYRYGVSSSQIFLERYGPGGSGGGRLSGENRPKGRRRS